MYLQQKIFIAQSFLAAELLLLGKHLVGF